VTPPTVNNPPKNKSRQGGGGGPQGIAKKNIVAHPNHDVTDFLLSYFQANVH